MQSIFSLEKISNGNMLKVVLILADDKEELLQVSKYKIENKSLIIRELPAEVRRVKVIYSYYTEES